MQPKKINKKKISDTTVSDIERLIGDKLAFIIAVDTEGKQTPLTSQSLDFEFTDMTKISKDNVIKNEGIFQLNSSTFISYFGSRKICYICDGKKICVTVK